MFYKRAIEACPSHTNNLGEMGSCMDLLDPRSSVPLGGDAWVHAGNYALFLADVRQNYSAAEDLYQRAIASDPTHANSLYNYAVLLDSVRHDYDEVWWTV